MLALLQRVTHANVVIEAKPIAEIQQGLLVFIGVEKADSQASADRCLERILNYRIFPDADDKMNLNVIDIEGEILLVPQFTLAADTRKGNRPSFTPAASPESGDALFGYLLSAAKHKIKAQAGQFGTNMQVNLCNDGPVTFLLAI